MPVTFTEVHLQDEVAVRVAEQLVDEMHELEVAHDEGMQAPSISDNARREAREKYPEHVVVRNATLRTFRAQAALLGAGCENPSQADPRLVSEIELQRDNFFGEVAHLYEQTPDGQQMSGFSHRYFTLGRETLVELLAYDYGFIGKISIDSFEEGEQ